MAKAKKKPILPRSAILHENIFSLVRAASRAMFYGGRAEDISEMKSRIFEAESYAKGVEIAKEYVAMPDEAG